VTITRDAKEFESLAPLPDEAFEDLVLLHCITAINADMIFITGLGKTRDLSFVYSKDTGVWSQMPNMPRVRSLMECGVVRDGGGKPEVVVVGGYDGNDVDIFNVEEETWRTASNPFPTPVYGPALAQVEDTFYVVGGQATTKGVDLDTIYRFESSDESWQLMPNRMKYPRYGATAMIVNASIFPTCD